MPVFYERSYSLKVMSTHAITVRFLNVSIHVTHISAYDFKCIYTFTESGTRFDLYFYLTECSLHD
jgi:hypothetical protein